VARRRAAVAPPEIRAAEAAVEPPMVPRRAVRPAVAVQSDVAVGSPGPRFRVDLVAAAEPAKAAAHPVRAAAPDAAVKKPAAAPVAAVVAVATVAAPDAAASVAVVAAPHAAAAGAAAPVALVVAPVPAVAVGAEPDAAAAVVGAVVPDALVVAPVPAVAVGAELDAAAPVAAVPDALVVAAVPAAVVVAEPVAVAAAAVALDAVVAVAGSAAAAAFSLSLSPFPDLLEALGRSQARHRMAWRVLIQAPQPTRSYRPKAILLFWASANDFCFGADLRFKFVPDESVPTGAQQIRSIDFRSGSKADITL
jgi:hypothetical protein